MSQWWSRVRQLCCTTKFVGRYTKIAGTEYNVHRECRGCWLDTDEADAQCPTSSSLPLLPDHSSTSSPHIANERRKKERTEAVVDVGGQLQGVAALCTSRHPSA